MPEIKFTLTGVAKALLLLLLGFISLPLSPLFLVATLIYQTGCVHGKLSPSARVATFVTCVFLATAWIPFVNFYYYFNGHDHGLIQCLRESVVQTPDGLSFTMFDVVWRDYLEEFRNDQGVEIDTILPMGTLAVFYVYGVVVAVRVYSIDDSYEEEKDRAVVERLRSHPLEPPILFTSKRTGSLTQLDNAYDMYMALLRETPDNATVVAVGLGTFLGGLVTMTARLVQIATANQVGYKSTCAPPGTNVSVPAWYDPVSNTTYPAVPGTTIEFYRAGPTYALSTVYFAGMFLVFFSTFAFVATLYINHVRVVWQLTFFAGGDASRANKTTTNSLRTGLAQSQFPALPNDKDALIAGERGAHESGTTAVSFQNSGMSKIDEENFNRRLSLGCSMQLARQAAVGGVPSPTATEDPSLYAMQPYNIMHLRAWDEVRQVAAMYIASPNSTLNAFLTPTMWLAVSALGGSSLYLIVTFFIQFKTIGPFSVTMLLFLFLFVVFFIIVSGIARVAWKHFKFHNVIVARIAFDLACEIDSRTPLVRQGIEVVSERRPGMGHLELAQLIDMHESVLGLLSFMEATAPRPLILGVELPHVKYGLAYFLLISANLLFIALMNASTSGTCFD